MVLIMFVNIVSSETMVFFTLFWLLVSFCVSVVLVVSVVLSMNDGLGLSFGITLILTLGGLLLGIYYFSSFEVFSLSDSFLSLFVASCLGSLFAWLQVKEFRCIGFHYSDGFLCLFCFVFLHLSHVYYALVVD
jgi:hypothetical protein